MATDFIMPRMPDPSQNPFCQPQHPPSYGSQHSHAQISPLSTSNNASPTSPKSYHTRQLRPLYMPAVLRPTEHPSKPLPAKSKPENANSDEDKSVRSSGSFISLPGLATLGMGRLARRSTADSGKCLDSSWNLDLFPEVKGQPSRTHWKADPESAICDEPTCQRHFSYFTRRHHCRRCGNIFCDAHSAHEVPLDENANYNPRGAFQRSCGHCFTEFAAWRSRTNSEASSHTPRNGPASPVLPSSPVPLTPGASKTGPDAAQSVPRDWNWSTF